MSIVLSSFRARLQAFEREITVEALCATHGAVKPAARLCGLHPSRLYRIIKRQGLQSLVVPTPKSAARTGNAAWRALEDA